MKLEDFIGSLEAHELRKRKGIQDYIQVLHAQTWKKHGGSGFKGKGDKSFSKKDSWLDSQKQKNHERTSESSKIGEGTSNHK